MDNSLKYRREQERLRNDNEKLKDEIEHLSKLLLRLDFASPPSIQTKLPATVKGKGYIYLLQEEHVQYSRDNQPGFNYKLGIATQDTDSVIETFQLGNPRKLVLKRCVELSSFEEAEKKLRVELKEWQITTRSANWYFVPNIQRPHFYGKFYETLLSFGVAEPDDIPKGWLLFSSNPTPAHEDKVWIATGGILYHGSKDCPVLVRKAKNIYPIYKSKILVHNRKPCRECVFRVVKSNSRLSRSCSFNDYFLRKWRNL